MEPPSLRFDEVDVLQAFATGEIEPWYQPLFCADTGDIVGVEALLRWRHPEHGVISAGQFLVPLLKDPDTAGPVSKAAFNAIAAHASPLLDAHPDWTLWVNVSVNHLTAAWASNALSKCVMLELPLDRLVIEITEHGLGVEIAPEVTSTLTEAGVSLALDDFGASGAWLNLSGFAGFSIIKIDRELVQSAANAEISDEMLGAVVNVAAKRGMVVVAEGIETERELAIAKAAGVNITQGFLLGRPMQAEELIALALVGAAG